MICKACHPMVSDMTMSSEALTAAMYAKIESEPARFAGLKNDPAIESLRD